MTYHDACYLGYAQGISSEPRQLVKTRAGGEFIEMSESDLLRQCGKLRLTEPEMAERLQTRKVKNIIDSGAEVVVTTNPGCLLQIQSGLKKAGVDHVRAAHRRLFTRKRRVTSACV